MPKPSLPSQVITRLPDRAEQQLIDRGPFESYTTVAYSGSNGGVPGSGLFVEVDEDTWKENNLFTFQEISESDEEIILYDAGRDTMVFINLVSDNIYVQWSGNELVLDLTDMSQSLTPVIPDGWMV